MAAPDPDRPTPGDPSDPDLARAARRGWAFFAAYLLPYAGFVAVSAFRPEAMDAVPFAGVNLAVLWGLGLIGGAALLAVVYGWLCRDPLHAKGGGA